ncbi:MAG: hypothetical protein MR328_07140, partial [Firmicutes bacterium]|nr:hypothetical protein [Bacillota bacterium]
MYIRQASTKKNNTPVRILLVQIILCILVIASIFIFGNLIFRDDLSQTKQVRLDAEVETMKEIVSNTIIRIDEQRETAKKRAMDLIEACTETVAESDDTVQSVRGELNSIRHSEMGRYVQALIVDDINCTLISSDYTNGVEVTQDEAKALLNQEAVRKTIEKKDCTVHLFALQSDIDEFVKDVEYKLFHKQ